MHRRLSVIVATAVAVFSVPAGVLAQTATNHAATPTRIHAISCKNGYYKNVSGHCVHRPVKASKVPAGATAKCRDGSYSFSEHASGTCSHHGGVARWIHHP